MNAFTTSLGTEANTEEPTPAVEQPKAHDAEVLRTRLRGQFQRGLKQCQVARAIGVSEPEFSLWYRAELRGAKSEQIRMKVFHWFRDGLGLGATSDEWVPTRTGDAIENALYFAHGTPSIAVIYGGAGVGKTTAIKRYREINAYVWVVTSSPARGSLIAVLIDVMAAIQMRGLETRRPDQCSRDIIERLSHTRSLLIVDEAQHLQVSALEELRAIHDAAGIGLCLSGNENVYAKLTGGNRKAEFAQFFSRIGHRLALRTPAPEDVAAILARWGVEGDRERAFGLEIAMLPGGLRGVIQCLQQASFVAKEQERPIDVDLMRAAQRHLTGAS